MHSPVKHGDNSEARRVLGPGGNDSSPGPMERMSSLILGVSGSALTKSAISRTEGLSDTYGEGVEFPSASVPSFLPSFIPSVRPSFLLSFPFVSFRFLSFRFVSFPFVSFRFLSFPFLPSFLTVHPSYSLLSFSCI